MTTRVLLSVFCFLSSFLLVGQVGIGTVDPKASLDIPATNSNTPSNKDGLLLPRINSLPITNPTDEQHGMLVYLSEAAGGFVPGYLYWDKNKGTQGEWVALSSDAIGWELNGNNNAASGINFIGTTNPEEVDFRVNNRHLARFTEKGQFELESTKGSIYIGKEAGEAHIGVDNINENNTFIGFNSGKNSISKNNTFIGFQSGMSSTTGRDNVALGTNSLLSNTTGDFNTGVGDDTLSNNTSGFENTAVGNDALLHTITGFNNTALGANAGQLHQSGFDNIFVGRDADVINIDALNNVIIGSETKVAGNSNTVVGDNSKIGDTTPLTITRSVALGADILVKANFAVAIGQQAAIATLGDGANAAIAIGSKTIVNADAAIAMGHLAAVNNLDNDTVINNSKNAIAIGTRANVNDGSSSGIAIGDNASVTSSSTHSIALGKNASSSIESNGIAIGFSAKTEAGQTIALGRDAEVTAGSNGAIAIGDGASVTLDADNSIALGKNASAASFDNAIAIGLGTQAQHKNSIALGEGAITTKDKQLILGHITEIDATGSNIIANTFNGNVATPSDARFKYDVTNNVPGLSFINALEPVTYKFNYTKYDKFHNRKKTRTNKEVIETGFIAQQVEKAMNISGYDFNGLVKPENIENDNYHVSYDKFVVPLVKGMQEQQQQIEQQQKEIDTLKRIVEGL